MANELDRPAAPALPLAPEGYERPYMDQNSNVLRLFFNRISTFSPPVPLTCKALSYTTQN